MSEWRERARRISFSLPNCHCLSFSKMASPQSKPEPEPFSSKSAFSNGMNAAATSAAAGVLVSAVQNSVQRHDKGALGVFTRTGSTIALFTAMGGVFAYTDAAVANIREKNDSFNGAAGGCAAGLVAGASSEY